MTLENPTIRITVANKGAELQSLYHKGQQTEYLWQADPAFWGKHSPVLFPIVGALKNNSFQYKGQSYSLGRHGFARDMEFSLVSQEADRLVFELKDSEETRKNYPFEFRFQIEYRLLDTTLIVAYRVQNPSATELLWFSLGAHPAFRVPLTGDTDYSNYYLEFDQPETSGRWPIVGGGLIGENAIPFLEDEKRIQVTRELFARDAVVLKGLKSTRVRLASDKHIYGFDFHFPGFPFMGIWASPGADFVCIEPWCGIADSVNAPGAIEEKEGIISLEPGALFERTWSVSF